MAHVTLDIVLECLFNVQIDEGHNDIYQALTIYLRFAEKRVWSVLNLPSWIPTPQNLISKKALETLDDFVIGIIQERKASHSRKNDLLQLLVDNYAENPNLPISLLRDQVLSFILAGHETTANALSWTWYMLSLYPSVAREIRSEAISILGNRTPQFNELTRLPYTKSVFEEVLRLYPPVWTISRTAIQDDKIGNIEISSGTNVMLCAYAMQRNQKYWPNPDGFDPTRFSQDQSSKHNKYTYFPFGAGVRSCLGDRFGLMEALILMTTITRKFDLSLIPGQNVLPEPMITLRPKGNVYMKLSKV